MDKQTETVISELQLTEQSLNSTLMQKQQFQGQLMEIESAIKELKSTKQAYKIVGNLMIMAESTDLEAELQQKKELLAIRIKTLDKQEQSLKEKTKGMQEQVMKEIKQ